MALGKRTKSGGTYYEGFSLTVNASTGAYVKDMTLTNRNAAINSVIVVPLSFGSGDSFKLEHLDAGDATKRTLATNIPNVGASAAWSFDFPALEEIGIDEPLRLTYTNAAGVAMKVWIVVEYAGKRE